MDLMQELIDSNKRRRAMLEKELADAEAVVADIRKRLRHVIKHGKQLQEEYGEATLPLGEPDDEEEATDEPSEDDADLAEARLAIAESDGQDAIPWEEPKDSADANTLTPEQISAASEKGLSPSEYLEGISGKPIRRRKAKATAEE